MTGMCRLCKSGMSPGTWKDVLSELQPDLKINRAFLVLCFRSGKQKIAAVALGEIFLD